MQGITEASAHQFFTPRCPSIFALPGCQKKGTKSSPSAQGLMRTAIWGVTSFIGQKRAAQGHSAASEAESTNLGSLSHALTQHNLCPSLGLS